MGQSQSQISVVLSVFGPSGSVESAPGGARSPLTDATPTVAARLRSFARSARRIASWRWPTSRRFGRGGTRPSAWRRRGSPTSRCAPQRARGAAAPPDLALAAVGHCWRGALCAPGSAVCCAVGRLPVCLQRAGVAGPSPPLQPRHARLTHPRPCSRWQSWTPSGTSWRSRSISRRGLSACCWSGARPTLAFDTPCPTGGPPPGASATTSLCVRPQRPPMAASNPHVPAAADGEPG